MTFTPSRFQTVPPRIEQADVPVAKLTADLKRLVARQRFAARMAPLADWLAHPEAAPHVPAPAGERAEWRHLLCDQDPDSAVPAFPYPTPQETP